MAVKVIRSGEQRILDVPIPLMERIKEDLSVKNPVYEQIMRYSQYGRTREPQYLRFYRQDGTDLIVPRGYEIPVAHTVIEDNTITNTVDYPEFQLELRDTQQTAYKAWKKNTQRGMIVLQTGKGKSILGCYIGYATKQKTLVVVQKNDLVDGWTKDLKLCFGLKKKEIGLIKAKSRTIGDQFTLATIQTLNKLTEEEKEELYNTFGLVICDEVHHSPAKTYSLFTNFNSKYFIGLTATDKRTDGLTDVQYWLFGNVCYRSKESLDDEDIMPYKVIVKDSDIVFNPPAEYFLGRKRVNSEQAQIHYEKTNVELKRAPLSIHDMRNALRTSENFNNLVCADIKREYENGKSCIVFLHEKEHIRELRERLITTGVPEDQVQLYYGDSTEPDEVLKERAESKEVLITIATFAKATEGTNVKSWERGFLVTTLNNTKNVVQAVGRCRRRKKGKKDVIIYDYHHPRAVGMNKHFSTRMKAYKHNLARVEKVKVGQGSSKMKKKIPIARGFENIRREN